MKMAKATKEDIEAALLLNGILDDVDDGRFPRGVTDEEAETERDPEHFDENDSDHLKFFYERVMHCVRSRPSGIARVIWGFATIVDNNILDPDKNVLELHPRLRTESLLADGEQLIVAYDDMRRTFGAAINFCVYLKPETKTELQRMDAAVKELIASVMQCKTGQPSLSQLAKERAEETKGETTA